MAHFPCFWACGRAALRQRRERRAGRQAPTLRPAARASAHWAARPVPGCRHATPARTGQGIRRHVLSMIACQRVARPGPRSRRFASGHLFWRAAWAVAWVAAEVTDKKKSRTGRRAALQSVVKAETATVSGHRKRAGCQTVGMCRVKRLSSALSRRPALLPHARPPSGRAIRHASRHRHPSRKCCVLCL